MQIISDANPLISILIKPSNSILLLFLEELELIAPELLFEEIGNNKGIIIEKSELTEKDVNDFINLLKNRIKIVPEEFFIGYREKAGNICPHEKDITYFALALFLKCPIWSNEKKLKEQDHIKIYTTKELIGLFGI